MSKKILITGITGFAGSHLARKLVREKVGLVYGTHHSGKSLSLIEDIKQNIDLHQLDLLDQKNVAVLVEKVRPDQIYHLAAIASSAESFNQPGLVLTNNINSQINLLEAVRVLGVKSKILIVSSAEVYGKVDPKDLPIDEDTSLKHTSPYAVSKIAQDFMGLQYFLSYGIDIVRVRPFNHIGPGQTDQFATSAFAKKIAEIEKGKREPILTVGNLESKRDFTDVKDMMDAYILLMEKAVSGEVYNIGSGRSYKMSDVLNILLSFSDSKITVKTDPNLLRPSDSPELLCDNTKINSLTGWKPQIPLETTLKEILEYWRQTV